MDHDRFNQQLQFLIEIDKLKGIFRRTRLMDNSRQENDAEHAWHLAMLAMVLAEHANDRGVDIHKVIRMVLVHDIVEIDAGDILIYDTDERKAEKEDKENRAAHRIFNMLPADQAERFRGLWQEFEKRETTEARFAAALDRLQPILHNYLTKGYAWKKHGVKKSQVLKVNQHIGDGSSDLWEYAKELIEESVAKGYLVES
jgi:putative hydrolase of HD superfamily